MIRKAIAATVAALAMTAGAHAQDFSTGDAARGETLFKQKQCALCHAVTAGVVKVGPSLFGIIGRESGTMEKFLPRYSPAMKNADITWTEEKIFEYIEAPAKFMPGNRMAFAGLKPEQDRLDVIAYLQTLK